MSNAIFVDATGSMTENQIQDALDWLAEIWNYDTIVVFNEFGFVRTMNLLFAKNAVVSRNLIPRNHNRLGAALGAAIERTKGSSKRILITDGYMLNEQLAVFDEIIKV